MMDQHVPVGFRSGGEDIAERSSAVPPGPARTRRVAILLADGFCLTEFSLVVDALRMANTFAGAPRYEVMTTAPEDNRVRSATGVNVEVDRPIDKLGDVDRLIVVGGRWAAAAISPRLIAQLRWVGNRGAAVCGLGDGVFLLARAGLLDGETGVVHWLYRDAFGEAFPGIETANELFRIGRSVVTCVGGMATMDLMSALIAGDNDWSLAIAVLDWLACEHPRPGGASHEMALQRMLRAAHPGLARLVGLMESNLAEPLACEALGRAVRVSRRQVQRWFRDYFGRGPQEFYRDLRLIKARNLLLFSSLSVTEVAAATGFCSVTSFGKNFRRKYGHPPSRLRRRAPGRPAEAGGGPGLPRLADALDSHLRQHPVAP
jgi:AraC family transcriptional regulator, glycine betaine-responsive activator